jgi:hypothetical protein
MNHHQKHLSACLIALAALFSTAPMAWAATAPSLGAASTFGALGGAGVTCTSPIPVLPAITVNGDVGTPGTAPTLVTGFPTLCSLSGTVQLGAVTAYANFMTAYTALASNSPADGNVCPSTDATHNLVGDIGTQTLSPGVYCLSGVITLTGTLTLDLTANGGGDGSGIWLFKSTDATVAITPIGGATPATRSRVIMANNGNACNVYWQSATAVTFSNTDFVGNVLAGSNITFAGSTLAGRALAGTASVTMTGSSITSCGTTGGNGNGHDNGHHYGHYKDHEKCNQGVGNGPEGCDPGNSNLHNPYGSNDENGGTQGDPGRKGGNK